VTHGKRFRRFVIYEKAWLELFASFQSGRCFDFAAGIGSDKLSRLLLRMTWAGKTAIILAESSAAGDGRSGASGEAECGRDLSGRGGRAAVVP
jgi:hypothetical protein